MTRGNPTKAESEWMDAITALGCIVCRLQGRGYVPGAVHHMIKGGRRVGHLFTILLCDPGHHKNANPSSGEVSRHPNRKEFERRYGTEEWLLEKTKEMLNGH